ncbi:MAG TPA: CGNR zinc finger domain-containing protein [Nannocystis exedens]|nr:CGNR zinc finger domain-containing protein [Nannocystis exedens]
MPTDETIGEVSLDWLVDIVNEYSLPTRRAANELNADPNPIQSEGPVVATRLEASDLINAANAWFEAFATESQPDQAAAALQAMLRRAPPTVVVEGHHGELRQRLTPDPGADDLDRLIATGALTLLTALTGSKPALLGTCSAERCCDVFVDRSPQRNRRFCCTRCQTRTRVSRHRAR